jgi:tetratricopeptide (TPR) repeat protein
MEDIYKPATQTATQEQKKQAYKISGDCYLKLDLPSNALFQYVEA